MKKCSKGHENPIDAIFCYECGEKLLETSESKKCPDCGTANPKDAIFCSNCGKSLIQLGKIKIKVNRSYNLKIVSKGSSDPVSFKRIPKGNDDITYDEIIEIPYGSYYFTFFDKNNTGIYKFHIVDVNKAECNLNANLPNDVPKVIKDTFNISSFLSDIDEENRCLFGSWISIILLFLFTIIFEDNQGVVNTVLASSATFCAILIIVGVIKLKKWPYIVAGVIFFLATLISLFSNIIGYYIIYLLGFIPVIWGLFSKSSCHLRAWDYVLSDR